MRFLYYSLSLLPMKYDIIKTYETKNCELKALICQGGRPYETQMGSSKNTFYLNWSDFAT